MAIYATTADRYLHPSYIAYSTGSPGTGGIAGATDAQITIDAMNLFIEQLDGRYYTVNDDTDMAIAAKLRAKVWASLNLPPNHPVKGVYVVRSRPVGNGTIWRDDPWFWIYPTTTTNQQWPPTFAYARNFANEVFTEWVHSAVAAILQ